MRVLRIIGILLLFLAGNVAHPISLELNTASAFARGGSGFVGFTLSFLDDTDPGWANTSILTIDLEDPRLNTLVANLSPGLLRVGGGGAWKIIMDVDGTLCAHRDTPADKCLTMSRWRSILDFATQNGVQLIWGLGAQWRANGTMPLDFSIIEPVHLLCTFTLILMLTLTLTLTLKLTLICTLTVS